MNKLRLLSMALLLSACAGTKPDFTFLEKTAVDLNSGLTWTRSANLPGRMLVWRGEDNVYEFVKRLNETVYSGYADWRVPTKEEMAVMIEYTRTVGYDRSKIATWPYNRMMELGFTDVRDYDYWTSSRKSPNEMWTTDMATGQISVKPESRPYYLWPVRGKGK